MTRFHFERPDGIQGSPQNSLIHLNEFVPPQGFEGGAVGPFVPSAPLNLVALAISPTEIDLDWDIPVSDGGSPITGYQIERQKEAEGFIIIVADTGNTDTFFNDVGLESDTLFSYRVAAINAIGVGPVSNIASATTLPPPQDPLLAIYPALADNTFQFYRFYQVNKNQVPTTLTNQPLAIVDTLGSGILQQASGFDIRVFDSAGSPLDYDVQSVNITTGEIIVWINMATVQDLDFVQLTFGKPTATDGSNPNTVWSNQQYVAYLNNDPTGGAGSILDSTTSPRNGDPEGGLTQVAGHFGNALNFDGVDGAVDLGNVPLLDKLMMDGEDISFSFIIKPDFPTAASFPQIISKGIGGASSGYGVFTNQNGPSRMRIVIDVLFQTRSNAVVTDTVFHHVVVTKTNGVSVGKAFIDGVCELQDIQNNNVIPIEVSDMAIGRLGGSLSRYWKGTLQHMTISKIIPSDNQIITEFNNKMNNDTFWFETPILENGEDNFLVDDMGRNIVAVQT